MGMLELTLRPGQANADRRNYDFSLVSRIRSSPHFAARSSASFGFERTSEAYNSSGVWFRSPHDRLAEAMMRTSETATLVSRIRSSPHFAARSSANFGFEKDTRSF